MAPRLAAVRLRGCWKTSIARRCGVRVLTSGATRSFQLVNQAKRTAWALCISADLISELEPTSSEFNCTVTKHTKPAYLIKKSATNHIQLSLCVTKFKSKRTNVCAISDEYINQAINNLAAATCTRGLKLNAALICYSS